MRVIFIVLYLTLAYEIQTSQTLQCYSCSGGQECGTLFSANSINIKKVKSVEKESLSSCSITVTPEGLTTRDLMPSHTCRSSSYQFCCNEDLCNSLASPPLPALTSLKCAIGRCSISNGICIDDAAHVTVLSSATESCSITFGTENVKYYKRGCQPTITAALSAAGRKSSSTSEAFCCNSPECNKGLISNAIKDVAIQCYTCDSRITGLAGCMIFNESSPYVYKAGSSAQSEACAVSSLNENTCSLTEINIYKTIVGHAGRDAVTGATYPAFTIRTFISKCVNKPIGRVSYGGANFQGRIECCSSHFCNTKTLGITKSKRKFGLIRIIIIIIIIVVVLLLILAAVVVYFVINRNRQKKKKEEDDLRSKADLGVSMKLLMQQTPADRYPEEIAGL